MCLGMLVPQFQILIVSLISWCDPYTKSLEIWIDCKDSCCTNHCFHDKTVRQFNSIWVLFHQLCLEQKETQVTLQHPKNEHRYPRNFWRKKQQNVPISFSFLHKYRHDSRNQDFLPPRYRRYSDLKTEKYSKPTRIVTGLIYLLVLIATVKALKAGFFLFFFSLTEI